MDQNSEKTINESEEMVITPSERPAEVNPAEVEGQVDGEVTKETAAEPATESEASAPEAVEEETPQEEVVDTSGFTAEELLKYLDEMVRSEKLPDLREMKRLKRLINKEQPMEEDDQDDLDDVEDDGEEKDDSKPITVDELKASFINLTQRYHELSAKVAEQEKKEREENYQKKLVLIQRLEENINSTDDFFKVRNEFQNIRNEWKSIGPVPDNLRVELINKYSRLLEEHYTINKLNKEAQEYDFRHNRKEKEGFIEKAKALADEPDVVKAFRELQTLHDLWRETGPVAMEFRDIMWKEFKDASTVINKRHDEYFKQLHEKEEENFLKKVKIVERLENMLITLPTTRSEWRKYEQAMDTIREDWRAAGRVPRAKVNEIRSRFRIAVDEFYLQRRTFMRELSEFITPRLERMRELASEAEELKDSTDWKVTSKKLQDMQKEWTSVAQLGTRVTEAQKLWRKFRGACDTFFANKSEAHRQRMASKEENYEKKLVIVEKLEDLVNQRLEDPSEELAAIEAEWTAIGLVPNEKKDEILNRYYGALRSLRGGNRSNRERDNRQGDRRRDRRGGNQNDRRNNDRRERKSQPVDMKKDLTKLSNPELEDEKFNIQRNITQLEEELLQYETNIGFFNASPDNPMIVQIQSKIDKLKGKIESLNARIKEIDEEIKNPTPAETEAEPKAEPEVTEVVAEEKVEETPEAEAEETQEKEE